jgi:hypothetical protein
VCVCVCVCVRACVSVSIVSVRVNVFVALNTLQSSLSKLLRVNRKNVLFFTPMSSIDLTVLVCNILVVNP